MTSSALTGEGRRDGALDFLAQNKEAATVEVSRISGQTRRLRRKIDKRLIPFLCLCYTMNFLDKVLLNVQLLLLLVSTLQYATRF